MARTKVAQRLTCLSDVENSSVWLFMWVSSRRIANMCETNITFMSLSGDGQSHFTSIANFVAKMKDQIELLFTQVLMICDREMLIGRNMFAIDGYKIRSNASKSLH